MKKFKLHPLFILYIVFLLIFGHYESLLVYLLVVILHELAHSFVAQKLGYKLDKMVLMPYGVCLNYKVNNFCDNDEILIAMAGPMLNAILAICTIASWWIFPSIMPISYLFCLSNVVMFLYNLLPCYPLDGGRILSAILSKKYDKKWSIKLCLFFNICFSFILILTFIIGLFFKVINTNLLIISIFLIMGIIEPNKYSSYSFLSYKIIDEYCINKERPVKFTLINSNIKIYKLIAKLNKNKFNIFYVMMPNGKIKTISEIIIKKFAIKYNASISLCEIPEMYL